jgi:GNAT superfamily N-acetyltransferase
MACPSHTAATEEAISRICADPSETVGGQRNPFVVMQEMTDEMAYRMQDVFCDIAGYRLAFDREAELLSVFDGSGDLVGGIFHKSILVLPVHRHRGLGSEILIRSFETGVMHPATMNQGNLLTTAGRANRVCAHRTAVQRAWRTGIAVLDDILSDYADVLGEWDVEPSGVCLRP